MALPSTVRAAAKRALSAAPVYRALPPGELRTFAAVHYHGARLEPEEICRQLEDAGRTSTRFHSAAQIAAQAALEVGRDDLAEEIAVAAARRYPDSAALPLLRSDLRVFRGDYAGALAHATEARLLDPDWAHAASQVVWLHYLTEQDDADRIAAETVRRFPRWGRILWAATRGCTTVEQFDRLVDAWRSTLTEPHQLLSGVRRLAQAAARVGLLDTAVELYTEAILLWMHGYEPPVVSTSRTLEDKDPSAAVADVCEALDAAGIPFFFAAGTALGLIRDGRPAGHDVDLDIGVFAADWDRDALVEAFRKHRAFAPNVAHPRNPKVAVRHRGGAPIDVFRFYEEGGRVWHEGTFMRWANTPFEVQRRTIAGVDVSLPVDEERYLEENYGPGWTEPDPGFDAFTDAPNVEATWPEYLEYYRVRRAYLRVTSREVRTGLRDVVDAADALRRTPSGRQLLGIVSLPSPPAVSVPAEVHVHLRPEMGPVARGELPIAPHAAIPLAREARARGDRDTAVETIEDAMRGEGWRHRLLWHERLTLLEDPSDYPAMRALFWASPRECHTGVGALRAVARGACMAGAHEEGRALLRKAIVDQAARRRRWGHRVRTGRRTVRRRLERRIRTVRAGPVQTPDGGMTSFERKAATALRDLGDVLDGLGVRSFLVAGTFLGLVREGSVIPGDKDIDIGVLSSEVDIDALEHAAARSEVLSVRRLDLSTDRVRVNHRTGVKIDVFPHYEEGGRIWHDGAATRWWNTPFDLQEVEFLGQRTLAPADAERYLTESYGDWRRPDPHFDARLDAPNVEVTDHDYFTSLQYFDLLKAIMKGNDRRRARHEAELRELGEGDWLDAL